ncbi:MAG: hypothetical protein ACFE0Q_12275 [Anaerolineae bacterium]
MMIKSNRLKAWQIWLVTGVLCVAYALFGIGIADDLPYHIDPDEPVLIINANELVTVGRMMQKPHYPPLFIWQLSLQRLVLDALVGGEAGDTIYFFVGRIASIGYTLLYLATAFALFRRFGHFLPSLLMMIFLAFEPAGLTLHTLAKADAISVFLATLTLLCTWHSWQAFSVNVRRAVLFILLSFVLGLASTLAKYNFLMILVAPSMVLLWHSIRLGWWGLLIGGVFVMVIGVFGVLVSPLSASLITYFNSYDPDLLAMPSAHLQFVYLMRFAGWGVLLGLLYPALLLMRFVQKQNDLVDGFGLVLIGTFIGGFLLYSATDWSHYRYSYLLFVLLTVAMVYSLTYIQQHSHWGVMLLIGLVLIGWRVPVVIDAITARFEESPQIRTGDWLVSVIDEPMVMVIERDNSLLNRQYSGIPLDYPVGSIVVESLFEQPLEAYRVQGATYLIADARAREGYFYTDAPTEFLNQTLEVFRDHPDSPQYIIFEILPPPRDYATSAPDDFTSAGVRFGMAVGLDSYQLALNEDNLTLSLAWQGMDTDEDYTYFVQINERETGVQIANINRMPLNYQLSTSLLYTDEILVDSLTIDLASASVGCYQITIGWYHSETGERLPAFLADDTALPDATYQLPSMLQIGDTGYRLGCTE